MGLFSVLSSLFAALREPEVSLGYGGFGGALIIGDWHRLTIFANVTILGIIEFARCSAMPMNISLTPHLEKMIREKIASGSYNSASEVVREALRLMEQEDKLRSLKLERLRQDVREGLDSGPSMVFDPQEIKRVARGKKSTKDSK
ncbi:MAG: type II toxin-antitoxin system ParD family antitoxin [Candidatus Acidiferrum sp.]